MNNYKRVSANMISIHKFLISLGALSISLGVATNAHADYSDPYGYYITPSPEPYYYLHNSGVQFRFVLGPGYLSDSETTSGTNATDNIHGPTGNAEFYLGGYVLPRLAIGGMLSDTFANAPNVSANGMSFSNPDSGLNLISIGPYADWYVSRYSGLHLMATAGFSNMVVSNSSRGTTTNINGNGFDVGGGIGYDWRVSDHWQVGVLGRFTYSNISIAPSTESVITPGVMFS